MLTINVDGMLKMCQKFLALPGEGARKLVNISSVGGGVTCFPGFRRSDGMSKGRLIEPAEIAATVHFLTTPASRVLHGAALDVSMGPGARPGLMSEQNSR